MSRCADLLVEIERLRQENDRLRTENAALRPLISTLRHDVAQKCHHCDYMPHDLKTKRGKNRDQATTRTYSHG